MTRQFKNGDFRGIEGRKGLVCDFFFFPDPQRQKSPPQQCNFFPPNFRCLNWRRSQKDSPCKSLEQSRCSHWIPYTLSQPPIPEGPSCPLQAPSSLQDQGEQMQQDEELRVQHLKGWQLISTGDSQQQTEEHTHEVPSHHLEGNF